MQERGARENQRVKFMRIAIDNDFGRAISSRGLDVTAIGNVLGAIVDGHGCNGDKGVDNVPDHSPNNQWVHIDRHGG